MAHELLASETIDLDRKQVAAIVTEEGGENSHAAILARALGIPAVTGVAAARSRIPAGAKLLVDGQTGQVTIAPTDFAVQSFAASKGHGGKAIRWGVAALLARRRPLSGSVNSLLDDGSHRRASRFERN